MEEGVPGRLDAQLRGHVHAPEEERVHELARLRDLDAGVEPLVGLDDDVKPDGPRRLPDELLVHPHLAGRLDLRQHDGGRRARRFEDRLEVREPFHRTQAVHPDHRLDPAELLVLREPAEGPLARRRLVVRGDRVLEVDGDDVGPGRERLRDHLRPVARSEDEAAAGPDGPFAQSGIPLGRVPDPTPYRKGSTTVRNGNRWKSVSRVQIRLMPCSRINTAVWRS